MSATSELQTVTATVSGGATWNFGWPANADGTFTIAPVFEESAPFRQPPADDAAAYRRAAYWTAIAARALADRTLAATSAAYLAKATASMASFDTANRRKILTDAAEDIESEIPRATAADAGEAQRRAIALQAMNYLRGSTSDVALNIGQQNDDSWLATIRREYDRIKEQIGKALKIAAIGAGVLSAAVVAGLVWWFVSGRRRRS